MDKRKLLIMFCLALILPAPVLAENVDFGLNYGGYYSDNIFMSATKMRDYISRVQADINISLQKFNLYLDASADIYTDNPDFNSFNIKPGIQFLHYLKGRNAIYLDLSYVVLNYKELYTDFNYSGPQFQADVKFYTSPRSILKAGYLFQARSYTNYKSFDFRNHTAFVEVSRFFKSQTTVRLQAGFNYRYYPHIIDIEAFDLGENYNYYDHKSHGNMFQMGQGSGPGFPPGSNRFNYNSMSVPNVYGLLSIVQGLGTRVGITGEAELRKNFRGLEDAESLIKNSYIIYPYNDDYLWDGSRFSLGVKAVLFKQFSVEAAIAHYNKNYPGIYVMDQEGNVLEPVTQRKDTLLHCRLKLSGKIGKWDLEATAAYRDNQSGDFYFLYKTVTISAGIGYSFRGLK
ncbi:MAG: hypothetical protein GY950_32910 [bacterium]|nr:hypothetical protein [bacterium]